MFDTIKKLFKDDEKEENEMKKKFTVYIENMQKEEKNKMEKIKEHLNEKLSEYIKLVISANINTIKLRVYLKGDYLGYVIADRDKIEAHDSETEDRILEMISKMVKDREEELEQLRIRKEMEKEKLEFMHLRNEMLKKKLDGRTDKEK